MKCFQQPNLKILHAVARQHWELSHSQITLDKKLGEGQFGDVFRGTLKTRAGPVIPVAIKTVGSFLSLRLIPNLVFFQLKTKMADKGARDMLMKEARMNMRLEHRNVIRMYGVAVDREP